MGVAIFNGVGKSSTFYLPQRLQSQCHRGHEHQPSPGRHIKSLLLGIVFLVAICGFPAYAAT